MFFFHPQESLDLYPTLRIRLYVLRIRDWAPDPFLFYSDGIGPSLTQPMDPEKKSLNYIFPTKHVIPESLKFSHWLSELNPSLGTGLDA